MRAPGPLLAAVLVLAGCTDFPSDSRLLAELTVGALGPGEGAVHNFTLAGPGGFLFVGFRHGPAEGLHLTLQAPNGTRFAATSAEPPGPCAVRAVPGAWALEVRADLDAGSLQGGKFTVRAAPGDPPALFACVGDVFPGRGSAVTLGRWELNLTPGSSVDLPFEQPYALRSLETALRLQPPAPPANATAGAANGSAPVAVAPIVLLLPPGKDPLPPADTTHETTPGTWEVRVQLPEDAPPVANATLVVRGIGS